MIIHTHTDDEYVSARRALNVIDSLRRKTYATTYPIRPDTENTHWVTTVWPHEWFL